MIVQRLLELIEECRITKNIADDGDGHIDDWDTEDPNGDYVDYHALMRRIKGEPT